MAKIRCPDCGFVHECDPEEEIEQKQKSQGREKKGRAAKGYSLYYVPCRCGCGCGHTCDLMYGPYGKAHNAQGRAALQGEVGEQLKAMREASAKVRKDHLAKIHGTT